MVVLHHDVPQQHLRILPHRAYPVKVGRAHPAGLPRADVGHHWIECDGGDPRAVALAPHDHALLMHAEHGDEVILAARGYVPPVVAPRHAQQAAVVALEAGEQRARGELKDAHHAIARGGGQLGAVGREGKVVDCAARDGDVAHRAVLECLHGRPAQRDGVDVALALGVEVERPAGVRDDKNLPLALHAPLHLRHARAVHDALRVVALRLQQLGVAGGRLQLR
mmetsp:Transcript_45589/g.116621  ORF Transcript_45589/g.116621 Transcript_45589/m.116621 type:complete len:223 (-) Transcript_45589:379-1047(-)